MDIHVMPNDPLLRIFHDGHLVGEIVFAHLTTHADLKKEVEIARCLRSEHNILRNAICKIAQAPTPNDLYCQGFISGVRAESTPHPIKGVPPICPNNDPRFVHGWEDGMFLRQINRQMCDEIATTTTTA